MHKTQEPARRRDFVRKLLAGSLLAIGLQVTACAPSAPATPEVAKAPPAPTAQQAAKAPSGPTAQEPAKAPPAPPAAKATRPKTVEPGVLKIAVMEGNMPYIALDPNTKKLIGYEGELMVEFAGKLDLRPEPMVMEWAAVIQSVQSGRADVAVSGIHVTPQRKQQFLLAEPIAYYLRDMTQKKNTSYKSLKDMQGRTFGSVQGFSSNEFYKKVPNMELKLYDGPEAALLDLAAGRVDAISIDAANAFVYMKERPDLNIKVEIMEASEWFPASELKGETAFVLNRNNPELHQALNGLILEARKTGRIKELMTKYGLIAPEFQIQS